MTELIILVVVAIVCIFLFWIVDPDVAVGYAVYATVVVLLYITYLSVRGLW